jgi:hypothetical protein
MKKPLCASAKGLFSFRTILIFQKTGEAKKEYLLAQKKQAGKKENSLGLSIY